MRRSARFFAFLPALMLALCASLALAGCDTNSDEEEAVFAQLQGSWQVESFRYDDESFLSELNGLYNNGTVFTFFEGEGRDLQYRISGFTETGENQLRIEGRLNIELNKEELDFRRGTFRDITVEYDIVDSDVLILTTNDDDDAEALFESLVDLDIGPQDDDQRVRIRLRKVE